METFEEGNEEIRDVIYYEGRRMNTPKKYTIIKKYYLKHPTFKDLDEFFKSNKISYRISLGDDWDDWGDGNIFFSFLNNCKKLNMIIDKLKTSNIQYDYNEVYNCKEREINIYMNQFK